MAHSSKQSRCTVVD